MTEEIEANFVLLCDKYCCSSKFLILSIRNAICSFYSHKKIISFDLEKQLIYELKDEKIVPFRAKKRDQNIIKNNLIRALEDRRNEIFLQSNSLKIREFYKNSLGEINRFSIIKIEDREIFLTLKSDKKVSDRVIFLAYIDDFLDKDLISIGYNFFFFIKNVEFKKEGIFIKLTRKKNEIIRKEVENIFDFIAKKYDKNIDFNINFIDFRNKKVVLTVAKKEEESILKSIKKIVKSRIDFEIFWKIRKERR
ncbi:hypothetical protein BKH42_03485 [Helicobacter sp. 13S00482-2]|uniref:hypothetical protein n=1 Tax=Helicobacter sp. 13S00482-2 TaxID=1476200 RepID=UPI000BA630EA|nr:hypothetical protein [Helicobacter sp. 13S00482-2]PAF53803.1 hypothetical protein BKH42_03485 [Helicobacter sp. 13S00482-2]